MFCNNCGNELKETDKSCSQCGKQLNNFDMHKIQTETDESNLTPKASSQQKKSKKIINVIVKSVIFKWIITSAICVALTMAGAVIADYYDGSGDLYRMVMGALSIDEKAIFGSWEMSVSSREEIFRNGGDLNGFITEITFYSDGTCTVGGTSSTESGYWSIVDNKLKIEGEMGGMFWNYNGFIMPYDLSSNTLTIYDDNNSYTYYRE